MPTISLDFQFTSSIERVWLALTDSKTLSKWIMDNDFKPIVGHKCQFRTEPTKWWNGIVDSEVLIVDEPNELSYTWLTGEVNTTVTWTLKELNETVILHLEHRGFESESQEYNGAKHGWVSMVSQLENMLAKL